MGKQEEEMMKQIMKAMKESGDKEEKQDTKGGQKKAPEPKKVADKKAADKKAADKRVADKKETKQQQEKKPSKAMPKVEESKAEKEKAYTGDPEGISNAIEDIAQTLAKLSIG